MKKIINEPTAAAVAKGINLKERKKTFVVFDFGGGTLDVTVMETGVENGTKTFQVLSTHGDTFLGGVDFDEVIMEMILEKIRTTFSDEFNEMLSMDGKTTERAKTKVMRNLFTVRKQAKVVKVRSFRKGRWCSPMEEDVRNRQASLSLRS